MQVPIGSGSGLARRARPWAVAALVCAAGSAGAISPDDTYKGQSLEELLSAGGRAAIYGPDSPIQSPGETNRGAHDNGRGGVTFVNDPCLDPPPTAPSPERRRRTVQSETEIAVLNRPGAMGKYMVAGYNDSWGFYDNTQGLSGFAYSINGGNTWIDGGGLPPRVPTHGPPGVGADRYFGDPVLVVHHASGYFFYASLYQSAAGYSTLSVNRGHFAVAPPQGVESVSNTRCLKDPTQTGIPDAPSGGNWERIVWEPPVEAVLPPYLGPGNQDFLDKEWLYVDQKTGALYLTYTRFGDDGSTPIELVRSYDFGQTWTPPTVIVPNEADTFNQATMAVKTPTGRLIVAWFARTFDLISGAELFNQQRIEYAYSDDDGNTFTPEQLVTFVRPQGEPPGYNRGRLTILNAPYINVDMGEDDGVTTAQEQRRAGFGNVYVTYFSGCGVLPQVRKCADIFVSTSRDDGTTFAPPVKVNDDATQTVHVFPSVQASKQGEVYVGWIDRRQDALNNIFNDTYAAVSRDGGLSFSHNKLQTDESTTWFVRADARPNFGDYNSSELLGFNQFVLIWADGRFWPPGADNATPDTVFTIANGLGNNLDQGNVKR